MVDRNMCPKFEAASELLGKKWTGLILYTLLSGPKRFKDIKATIPQMSDKMLSDRMKELEYEGIVERHVYPETPVRIEYTLTAKGKSLKPVIDAIQAWADQWIEVPLGVSQQ
ncbi:MAG: helix-turn-helix transcriptional regulator [Candidatus Carbobacillus altaicus]|uniref:Transcriptional regulator, HxlR family n=1 Tax=Candidatus Carbonibacillus altaicus TaxID=2163959 RepID=A0A2R6Y352_9BACL|nr:helix-turn-helix transcriptional regulator [Candidatus Carbobacillus altaicus]PTQ57116.1 MAG: Transcriptional regulator, HxlR family [Candidatus Carbobacillus altaicus]